MSTCPIVRKEDLSKVDEIMKSIKVKLQKDGLIQSSGGKSRRRKRHGGQERQNITLLLCKAVVLFHEIYEKFQDYTCSINDIAKSIISILGISTKSPEYYTLMHLFSNPIYIIILVAYLYYNSKKNEPEELVNALVTRNEEVLHEIVENNANIEEVYENNNNTIPFSETNPMYTNKTHDASGKTFRFQPVSYGIYEDTLKKNNGGRRRSIRRKNKSRKRHYTRTR